MKLNQILQESDELDAFRKRLQTIAKDTNTDNLVPKFNKWKEDLSDKQVALLMHMVKQQRGKRGVTQSINPEDLETFRMLGLLNNKNSLNPDTRLFLNWYEKNLPRSREWSRKRNKAMDALSRGHLKRDNEWTDPTQKRARKIIKSLSDDEMNIFRKVFNRFLNKRTSNLAKSWGNIPATDLIAMQKRNILDDDGNLTDIGEFAVNYYMAFKDDPDGLDRVSKARRVGNYKQFDDRRTKRMKRFTTGKTSK